MIGLWLILMVLVLLLQVIPLVIGVWLTWGVIPLAIGCYVVWCIVRDD